MDRKKFLRQSLMAGGVALLGAGVLYAANNKAIITAEEITEFVFAAHSDLEKTKSIADKKPLILNCTNQFSRGDFETALGGACHMGRKDIADMLIQRGARMDLFNLTFMGHTDLVKKMIESYPQYLNAPGPHGFTFLHHAKVGKHTDFASWLQDKGLTTDRFKDAFSE